MAVSADLGWRLVKANVLTAKPTLQSLENRTGDDTTSWALNHGGIISTWSAEIYYELGPSNKSLSLFACHHPHQSMKAVPETKPNLAYEKDVEHQG